MHSRATAPADVSVRPLSSGSAAVVGRGAMPCDSPGFGLGRFWAHVPACTRHLAVSYTIWPDSMSSVQGGPPNSISNSSAGSQARRNRAATSRHSIIDKVHEIVTPCVLLLCAQDTRDFVPLVSFHSWSEGVVYGFGSLDIARLSTPVHTKLAIACFHMFMCISKNFVAIFVCLAGEPPRESRGELTCL
jgi:hypothetical protein